MKYFTGQYIALSQLAWAALGSTSFVTGRKRAQKNFQDYYFAHYCYEVHYHDLN